MLSDVSAPILLLSGSTQCFYEKIRGRLLSIFQIESSPHGIFFLGKVFKFLFLFWNYFVWGSLINQVPQKIGLGRLTVSGRKAGGQCL